MIEGEGQMVMMIVQERGEEERMIIAAVVGQRHPHPPIIMNKQAMSMVVAHVVHYQVYLSHPLDMTAVVVVAVEERAQMIGIMEVEEHQQEEEEEDGLQRSEDGVMTMGQTIEEAAVVVIGILQGKSDVIWTLSFLSLSCSPLCVSA